MKDLRVFLNGGNLYLYDRGALRMGSSTPVIKVKYSSADNTYYITVKDLSTCEGMTSKVEEMIVSLLDESSSSTDIVKRVEAEQLIAETLAASGEVVKKAFDLINPEKEDNVSRIMNEIAKLPHKEKAELLMQIIDLF